VVAGGRIDEALRRIRGPNAESGGPDDAAPPER
jgi:hypothetical protein